MRVPRRRRLLLTCSGELHLKSRRTRRKVERVLRQNLQGALDRDVPEARVATEGERLLIEHGASGHDRDRELERAAEVATRVFGVQRADLGAELPADDLDALAEGAAELARERVAGRTFAVLVNRRGSHGWRSPDAARRIGSELVDVSAGVDLDHPEAEVRVEVYGEVAYLVERRWAGAGGAPLGTQEPVLALFSGGFDSPVASWMMMRRGSPAQLVHFQLDCASSDHAIATAHDLARRWAPGAPSPLWKVDFQGVKDALMELTPPRLRQVVLKQLMYTAADRLADRLGIAALVTGESVGQVSSQTLRSLVEIEAMVDRPVLRPLAGHTKDEIIDRARDIGTASLSARAREVCDLADGPVAVAPQQASLDQARSDLPTDLIPAALSTLELIRLDRWQVGQPGTMVGTDGSPDGEPGSWHVRSRDAPSPPVP